VAAEAAQGVPTLQPQEDFKNLPTTHADWRSFASLLVCVKARLKKPSPDAALAAMILLSFGNVPGATSVCSR